ncbi:MAG: virulence-related protein [Eubacteriaceae bacterium]|nr:virulence-related protein [Eubacteriaceae bacterium]
MDRKEMVARLGEFFETKPRYLGPPSFAYLIETGDENYTIDREGNIMDSKDNRVDFEMLISGKKIEMATEMLPIESFEVTLKLDGHGATSLRNLANMIYSNQELIKKAFNLDYCLMEEDLIKRLNEKKNISIDDFQRIITSAEAEKHNALSFDFGKQLMTLKLSRHYLNLDETNAFMNLAVLMSDFAKTMKHVSSKPKETDNPKFAFRVWLIRLGMVGDRYKLDRKVLLSNLEGNSAFRTIGKEAGV